MTTLVRKLTMESPIGALELEATAAGLTKIRFEKESGVSSPQRPSSDGEEVDGLLVETAAQLSAYFNGDRRTFDVPLNPEGTPFQLEVWRALLEIPWGEVTSYGALAERIDRPRAVRAVGAANGRNPIPIVIPCHRVIGRDGTLTGYGGGLEPKTALLLLEGRRARAEQASLFAHSGQPRYDLQ